MSPRRLAANFAIALCLAVVSGALGGSAAGIVVARAQESEATGIFHGVGVVMAVDAATGALTLNHEEIKGFMAAMEMMYRVAPRTLSAGLRPGDRVGFDIDAKAYTIVRIEVLEQAK